jgi:hypothetical protein
MIDARAPQFHAIWRDGAARHSWRTSDGAHTATAASFHPNTIGVMHIAIALI